MESNHSIRLADGTVIENLGLNGNNYISPIEVSASLFTKKNCSPVILSDGVTDEEHSHMELVHILPQDGEWWIALRDISQQEIAQQKLRADIDYIAMMDDIEL